MLVKSRFYGKLNPNTGCPELWYNEESGEQRLLNSSSYNGIVRYSIDNKILCVYGNYWEGDIPLTWIGKVLELKLFNGKY